MTTLIHGHARVLGDDINTDLHCSTKYTPGKDTAYAAQHAFERLTPGYAARFQRGDVVVAGRHFGHNSSREEAAHVLRLMGASALVAVSCGRQFFRNAVNNGLPVIECTLDGIQDGDEIEIDLAAGRLTVPACGIERRFPPLARERQALLAAGGLIAYLQKHPDWSVAG